MPLFAKIKMEKNVFSKILKSHVYMYIFYFNILFPLDGHVLNGINYITNAFNLILIEPRAEARNQHVSH